MKVGIQLLVSSAVLIISVVSAFAQSAAPSRVTPETLAPAPVRTSASVSLGVVEPGQVPAGAEALSVTIGSVQVVGGQPSTVSASDKATAKLKGHKVSVKEIYGAAAEIEAAYARAGYVLTRVTVPPQKLTNGGVLKLAVIDGFIEAIDDSAVPERQRAVVRARVEGLIGVRGLTLSDIERKLLIAADVPGVHLRSALVKGAKIGGAKLVLEADWRPVSASIGVDNKVDATYKSVEFPMSVSLNSVFGHGELIYGSAIAGPDVDTLFSGPPTRRVYGLGAIVPLGVDGLTVNPEYTRSDTNPRVFAPSVRTTGRFERWAVRSLYPIIKTRGATLTISGSFEAMNETEQLPDFDATQSIDRLRIFTVGLEGFKALDWNANLSGGVLFTQGVDALGARDQADATASGIALSRQGSRPDYTKIEGHLRYDQRLPDDFTGTGIFRAQKAISGPMPSAGQFGLDGDDGLSAFALGALSVDSGITARGELGHPFAFDAAPFRASISPYLFAAFGIGTLESPTAVESAKVTANAYGMGLRINLAEANSGVTSLAAIEIGRAHADTVAKDDTRIAASWIVRY